MSFPSYFFLSFLSPTNPTPPISTSTAPTPSPHPQTHSTPPGCRHASSLSRPAMPLPTGIGVPDDLLNELKPNFARRCVSLSSSSYPKLVDRGVLKPPGSACQQPPLPVLDLSSANNVFYDMFIMFGVLYLIVCAFLLSLVTFLRIDDDVEKRYESMNSKSSRPLSNTIETGHVSLTHVDPISFSL
ncbi:hypothetical protein EJB05_12742, partial [Eragrostis curvula]